LESKISRPSGGLWLGLVNLYNTVYFHLPPAAGESSYTTPHPSKHDPIPPVALVPYRLPAQRLVIIFDCGGKNRGSTVALLGSSSGRFKSSVEAIKGEAITELAAAESGLLVVRVTAASLKKVLGCAPGQKWQARAEERFNPAGRHMMSVQWLQRYQNNAVGRSKAFGIMPLTFQYLIDGRSAQDHNGLPAWRNDETPYQSTLATFRVSS